MRRFMAAMSAAIAIAVLAAGCEDTVEPTKYKTLHDRDAFVSTRDEVEEFFHDVTSTGRESTSAESLRGGTQVIDPVCDELYPETFRKLQIGGSFLVRDAAVDDIRATLQKVWEKKGWKPKPGGDGSVFVETRASTGVRITAVVDLEPGKGDRDFVVVSVKSGTGCLKVPKDALESGK